MESADLPEHRRVPPCHHAAVSRGVRAAGRSAVADGPRVPRAGSRLCQFVGVGAPFLSGRSQATRSGPSHIAATAVLGEEAAVAADVGTVASCAEGAAVGLSTTDALTRLGVFLADEGDVASVGFLSGAGKPPPPCRIRAPFLHLTAVN